MSGETGRAVCAIVGCSAGVDLENIDEMQVEVIIGVLIVNVLGLVERASVGGSRDTRGGGCTSSRGLHMVRVLSTRAPQELSNVTRPPRLTTDS